MGHQDCRCDAPGPRSSACSLQHLLPRGPAAQAHPHPAARETFASGPLHTHPLLLPARQPLTHLPAQGGRELRLYGPPAAGAASRDSLCATASGPAASRTSGRWRPLSLPSSAGGVLYGFPRRFPLLLPPTEKRKEYHRELWGRAARPAGWVWREVGEGTRRRGRAALPSSVRG